MTDRNILVVKNSTRLKKIMMLQKRKNQDGMWRSYMLNDRKCKILQKRNLVKVGIWKCSGTISRNVCVCESQKESNKVVDYAGKD